MKKLLPIILLLIGAGGGVGAGLFLRPDPVASHADCAEGDTACTADMQAHDAVAATPDPHGDTTAEAPADQPPTDHGEVSTEAAAGHGETAADGTGGPEYVALRRQMIVPIVSDDKVISLVVLSLSIEVEAGYTNEVYDREPKLRDAFLQVLFRHANTGGFNGDFTSGEKMADLRRALNSAAAQVLGPAALQVLVTDINRQAT